MDARFGRPPIGSLASTDPPPLASFFRRINSALNIRIGLSF
jgi:hypothetical protein